MEESLIKRVPPHSMEAEQSVLGAMLMDRDAITTAAELISGQDFYQSAYGVVFDAVVELFNEGKPADLITLQDRRREKEYQRKSAVWSLPGTCWLLYRLLPMQSIMRR